MLALLVDESVVVIVVVVVSRFVESVFVVSVLKSELRISIRLLMSMSSGPVVVSTESSLSVLDSMNVNGPSLFFGGVCMVVATLSLPSLLSDTLSVVSSP